MSLSLVLLLGPSASLPKCAVLDKLEYQVFATMLSFYIPLIIVLIIYANIYRTARTAVDNRSSVQMSQFLNHNNSTLNVGQPSAAASLTQQQLNGNSCSTPQLLLGASNANNNNAQDNDDQISTSGYEQRLGGRRSVKRTANNSGGNKATSFLSPSRCLGRRISAPFNGRLSIFVTRRYSFFRHVQVPNQKAIRTLGVILGTFIVCWLPFMLLALIKPIYARITLMTGSPRILDVPGWVDSVLLWFGYSSSMLNPVIYSKFNREFRTPFREIICCHCRGLNDKIRRQEYLENLYGDNHLEVPPPAHNYNQYQQQQQQPSAGTHKRGSGTLEAAV